MGQYRERVPQRSNNLVRSFSRIVNFFMYNNIYHDGDGQGYWLIFINC